MSTDYGTGWLRTEYDDCIIVKRSELPKVCVDTSGRPGIPGITPEIRTESAEKARLLGAAWLALAEYLAAHPPVPPVSDEDVETLAGLLSGVAPLIASTDTLAHRLLATGRVSVTK